MTDSQRLSLLEVRVRNIELLLNTIVAPPSPSVHIHSEQQLVKEIFDLPPVEQAPSETYTPDGRAINPGQPLSIPQPNTAPPDYPSLTSEDQTRREREKGINQK